MPANERDGMGQTGKRNEIRGMRLFLNISLKRCSGDISLITIYYWSVLVISVIFLHEQELYDRMGQD
jgi:hypothetical protein